MKKQKKTEDADAKLVVSSRFSPQLKQKVLSYAGKHGLTASELIENSLANYNFQNADDQEAALSVTDYKESITRQQSELELAVEQLKADNQRLANHNESLLKWIADNKYFLDVYDDPQLRNFFKQLQGTNDEIELQNGTTFKIQFNTMRDVLIGLIYSVHL